MRSSELLYDLPPQLIAQRPAEPRDAARLLVLDRATGRVEHRVFREIGEYLSPGDCLVLNDTRVIPARFFCRRGSGGRVEGLFLRQRAGVWRALLKPSGRLRVGQRLRCEADETTLVVIERHQRGEWSLRPEPAIEPYELLKRAGQTPLPPYIQRDSAPDARDAERYQTVYARHAGAVAAPTAGLHFTPELLERLRRAGVRRADLTLHVGLGTFAPIKVDDLAEHGLHAEWFEVGARCAAELRAARARGGRIAAVGTTSARVLESLDLDRPPACAHNGADVRAESPDDRKAAFATGWTDLFIYPPYRFRNVERLLTNFHLPGSTLLALVMAFAGVEQTRAAYRAAIEHRYRFYSYGDAMLIL